MKLIFFKSIKFWIFTIFFFVLAFSVGIRVRASVSDNVSGWSWGGSEETADGSINGNETGVGWISMNNVSSGDAAIYGVNIPNTNGNLSGYAWSENVGWITFNSSNLSGCPSGTCTARRVDDTLKGWARIMSLPQAGINAGGWDGWIKLGSEVGDSVFYGVTINPADGTLSGYAWNGEKLNGDKYEGFGWIDFSLAKIGTPTPPPSAVPCTVSLTSNPSSINLSELITLSWTADSIAEWCMISGNGINYTTPDHQSEGISWEDPQKVTPISAGNPHEYKLSCFNISNAACGGAQTNVTVGDPSGAGSSSKNPKEVAP